MIYAFIVWLIREYRRTENKSDFIRIVSAKIFQHLTRVIPFLFLLLLLLVGIDTSAQSRERRYTIRRGDRVIGSVIFTENRAGETTRLKLVSQVDTRFVLKITGEGKEEALYHNGVLVWSSLFRRQNGREKANKQFSIDPGGCLVRVGTSCSGHRPIPVARNMLSLYSSEPVAVSSVFSENFERMIAVTRDKAHTYRIELPDGSYNFYVYHNGVLERVEVHQPMFSATIQLIK